MTEDRDDIIVLVDEDGEEVEFELIDTIEMNGNEYVVMLPLEEDEEASDDEDVDEVVIFKIEHGDEGEDSFLTIEDENELNEVFEEFTKRMDEEPFNEDEE
jgi:uncharacterized protein YrzB (UPF0473 family)